MTYCAGWIYRGAVCLVADSAVTTNGPARIPLSTMGEATLQTSANTVEEGSLKIVELAAGVIAALAGDIRRAHTMLHFLAEQIADGTTIPQAIASLQVSFGPFSANEHVSLLIGISDVSEVAKLYRWNTGGELEESHVFSDIGSISGDITPVIAGFIDELDQGDTTTSEVVDLVSSYVQALTVHDTMFNWNVGGIVTGVRSEHGEVSWQSDKVIVPIDGVTITPTGMVNAICREGTLAVRSSINNSTTIFATTLSTGDIRSPTWYAQIEESLSTADYRCYQFIDVRERAFTVVFRDHFDMPPRYTQFVRTGPTTIGVEVSEELIKLLGERRVTWSPDTVAYAVSIWYD